MKCLRVPFALFVLWSLVACGGGSDQIRVAVFGDSLTRNDGLTVTTVQRMRQQLGSDFLIVDYSVAGMTANDALNRFPFATDVQIQQPDVTAILFGGADVIARTDPGRFDLDMRNLVAIARTTGSQIILATVIDHPCYEEGIAPINRIIRQIATDTGSSLADVYVLPVGDFIADGVHPNQLWSDARSTVISQTILDHVR